MGTEGKVTKAVSKGGELANLLTVESPHVRVAVIGTRF